MPKAILEHILEGPIASGSVEAFGSVVKEFPEDPELLKLFADFLAAKGKGPFAAQHYSKASEIFLSSGRLLHAVVAKMLEWRIDRPPRKTLLRFLSAISVHPHDESPVNRFLQSLLSTELHALFFSSAAIDFLPEKPSATSGSRKHICGSCSQGN